MGAVLSMVGGGLSGGCEARRTENCKRRRVCASESADRTRLIPDLPDEISLGILARLPRACYLHLRMVCRKWKDALTCGELFRVRKEMNSTEEWLYLLMKDASDKLVWHALDTLTGLSQRLPDMPCYDLSRPAAAPTGFWSRSVTWFWPREEPDCTMLSGCTTATLHGTLYVIGGFIRSSPTNRVWKFDPRTNAWSESLPMLCSRAYTKAAILGDELYVVGGVGRVGRGLVALSSVEAFDPFVSSWRPVPSMPFTNARSLPAVFLADVLRPVATEVMPYRGRLCVLQSLYSWPFFVDVGGEVYNPDGGLWSEMPSGMGDHWPARQSGSNLSAVVDGELYGLDPYGSTRGGSVKVYDAGEDSWKSVVLTPQVLDPADVVESPYLLVGFHGKLHIISLSLGRLLTVLEAASLRDPSNLFDPREVNASWRIVVAKELVYSELVCCQVLGI